MVPKLALTLKSGLAFVGYRQRQGRAIACEDTSGCPMVRRVWLEGPTHRGAALGSPLRPSASEAKIEPVDLAWRLPSTGACRTARL
jgi:hypothetical protein